ncbi:MAG: radical SAM protein [Nitrospirae bacterium]|nr:MAG: radical SAM protein [Nitrospirota bacterium]
MFPRELTLTEIKRIIDEMAELEILYLNLTGGEPLARPDFFQVYEHAKSNGFLVTLFTNGTLITEEVADQLAALPPHRIEISLHGLRENTFEAVTQGKGSFQRCMRAIQLLLDRKLPLTLKTTAMTVNKDEILAVKRYVQSLGPVGYKLGEEMRPTLDGSDAPDRWALSEAELLDINQQDPELWNETCRKQSLQTPSCVSGRRSFHIDAYGQLQLCSGNRLMSYDLRRGSFSEGFYHALPSFACPFKADAPAPLIQPSASHA